MTTSMTVGGEFFSPRIAKSSVRETFAIGKSRSANKSDPSHSSADENRKNDSSSDFLPTRVMKAIALAYESSVFSELHITSRQVLAALIRFSLNAEAPEQLAFVKKETLARHVGVSETTVYRCLTALEGEGLIEREKQQRSRIKLQVIGKIRFTTKLLNVLGFPVQSRPPREGAGGAAADSTGASIVTQGSTGKYTNKSITYRTGIAPVEDVNPVNQQSSSKKQPLGGSLWKSINGKAVPADLAWLNEANGLTVPAIYLLMKSARLAGQRLSDVVAVTKHALQRLKGRELFAYVSALLTKDVDYGYVAAQAASEKAEIESNEADAAAARTRIAQLATTLRGKSFVLDDGSRVSVDEASVVVHRTGYTSSTPLAMALPQLEALAAGAGASVSRPDEIQPRYREQMAASIAAARAILRKGSNR